MVGPEEAAIVGGIIGAVVTPLSTIALIHRDRVRRGFTGLDGHRNYGALQADIREYIPKFALSFLGGPVAGALLGLAVYGVKTLIAP